MIGNLRTRVAIQVPQAIDDDMGGAQTQWLHYANAWAHISSGTLQDRMENGRLAVVRSYKVTIRWQRNFPQRARIHFDDKVLRVLSASDPDLRHERLHLICEEEEQ